MHAKRQADTWLAKAGSGSFIPRAEANLALSFVLPPEAGLLVILILLELYVWHRDRENDDKG